MALTPYQAELVAASDPTIQLATQPTTVRVVFNLPAHRAAVARRGATPIRAFLNLENVTGAGTNGNYEVFINTSSDAEPLYAGHLSTFGVAKASLPSDHHGGGGITTVLDISALIGQLERERGWDGHHLDVTIAPEEVLTEGDRPRLTIGRLSVFLE